MKTILSLVGSLLLIGCASINNNPDILMTSPYNAITYKSEISDKIPRDVISVTRAGDGANILNTIPSLYDEILDRNYGNNSSVEISNLDISNYIDTKTVSVSYEECRSVANGRDVNGYTQYKQECKTRYRDEVRHTLFQTVTAEVY